MNRRGVSLLVVLLTLVFLGGVSGLLLTVARLRWSSGVTAIRRARAEISAAGESERILADWDPLLAESLAVGQPAGVVGGGLRSGVSSIDTLLRMGDGLFFLRVVVELRDQGGGLLAREGVARLVELALPGIPDSQAVASTGPIAVLGEPVIDGYDHLPSGWDRVCPLLLGLPAPGVRSALPSPVANGCASGSCLSGVPPTVQDSTLGAGFPDRLGSVTLSQLESLSDHVLGGTVSIQSQLDGAGQCDRTRPDNWGDPSGTSAPCARYFPLIVARDGARVEGGSGQGVLIGQGRLELTGDLVFHGVVLARGPLTVGDRARVVGTVLAADSVQVLDRATIQRSTCAVRRAVAGAGRPKSRVQRGWVRWP